jgi:hypothetical protein
VDTEHTDADTVHQPDEDGGDDGNDNTDLEPVVVDQRGHHEARHRGDSADREIDASRQHRERLTAREDRQRHGGLQHDPGPFPSDDAWIRELG